MKRILILALMLVLVMCAVFAGEPNTTDATSSSSDSSVLLKYTKKPTPGFLSIIYNMSSDGDKELHKAGATITDDYTYDLAIDNATTSPIVITWTGNMLVPDSYTVTFSTEGWKHSTSTTTDPIAVSFNVGVNEDQNPNEDGNQNYVTDKNADSLKIRIPALTNTDGKQPLNIAELNATWTSPEFIAAGDWTCTININVSSGD